MPRRDGVVFRFGTAMAGKLLGHGAGRPTRESGADRPKAGLGQGLSPLPGGYQAPKTTRETRQRIATANARAAMRPRAGPRGRGGWVSSPMALSSEEMLAGATPMLATWITAQ